eukprot:scaffold48_cov311-Pinguiococcus_pyrenoidosus.AAC.53
MAKDEGGQCPRQWRSLVRLRPTGRCSPASLLRLNALSELITSQRLFLAFVIDATRRPVWRGEFAEDRTRCASGKMPWVGRESLNMSRECSRSLNKTPRW